MSHDVLLTHSAPAVMRRNPSDHKHTYLEEGTMVLWRWLGMDRFFPPGTPPQAVLRGCATVGHLGYIAQWSGLIYLRQDYQESCMFQRCSYSREFRPISAILQHLSNLYQRHHSPSYLQSMQVLIPRQLCMSIKLFTMTLLSYSSRWIRNHSVCLM